MGFSTNHPCLGTPMTMEAPRCNVSNQRMGQVIPHTMLLVAQFALATDRASEATELQSLWSHCRDIDMFYIELT